MSCRADPMTVNGQLSRPRPGSYLAVSGQSAVAAVSGRPPLTDPGRYVKRHVIENSFERFKQWRGLATRYDKLASTYRAAVLLRAILLWLPALTERP